MQNIKNLVNSFVNKKSDIPKIIVIYGPTACGKTDISIQIAKQLQTEIISTDSRQIFKYMDIGTGKVTKEEMQGVKHHMIDIIEPDYKYSVGEFQDTADKIIKSLISKGKIPILAGGTGLYIDSLIYDFNIPEIPADWGLREKLEKERIEKGNLYIYEKLKKIDPEYAKELHPNNYRYVMRAIEIKTLTGKSKLEYRNEKILKYDTFFYTPYDGNRQELYNRINKREEILFNGALEETKEILKKGYAKTSFGLNTIGYKDALSFSQGNITKEQALENVQKSSRNYAKRQITWFRNYKQL